MCPQCQPLPLSPLSVSGGATVPLSTSSFEAQTLWQLAGEGAAVEGGGAVEEGR